MDRMKAALLGAREVGFTVLSISISLVAVFIPLLFMGGQVGRLFREFAVTLSAAVMISLVISLTTTPMMCAWLLRRGGAEPTSRRAGSRAWPSAATQWVLARATSASLDWALASKALVMLILVAVVGLNVYLFAVVPKGFFPQQDTGQLNAGLRADQSISFAGDGGQAAPGRRHHPQGPGGRYRGRLHRRHARRRRLHVRQPEARSRSAPTAATGGDRAAAAAARPGHRPVGLPEPGAGRAHRAGGRATPPTSTR